MRHIDVIVDLQFGSTGKGLLAGYLAENNKYDTIITAWGPNAGHTYINRDGRKFVNIALPNGLVCQPRRILLGPGSVIDPDRLLKELNDYDLLLTGTRVMIHPHAAVVSADHRFLEAQYGSRIGSTMKGVGEALIHKIRRDPDNPNIASHVLKGTPLEQLVLTRGMYEQHLNDASRVLIEGCQGYSLGINSGYYPYVTSRECTVAQLIVDCGLPIHWFNDMFIHGVARTFPIRVANRVDKNGVLLGTSGPPYPDQEEIGWADIGREPELTTVTKLPRRIFTWSRQQVTEAIRMNEVQDVFLNFCNYVLPREKLQFGHPDMQRCMDDVRQAGAAVRWLGFGPTYDDIWES